MPAEVHFFVGRAGTGKTVAVYSALKEKSVLFVPEQFTFETERALSHKRGGLMGVRVLSVSRLRELVIKAQERPYLSPQGRRMVVRRAAYKLRSSLNVFADAAKRAGFAKSMDDMLSTCRQSKISPDDLRQAAKNLGEDNPLALKLVDIALIYETVTDYLEQHYIDNEGAQDAVLTMLPNSDFVGGDIYFDGFEAVNEQLYSMLGVLMRIAKSLTFTICMDPDELARDYNLFAPERRVYDRLRSIASSLGCKLLEKDFEGMPLSKDAALFRLERELFTLNPRKMAGPVPSITLMGAGSRAEEVDALADAILKAAKQGLRYRDMAVIASDMKAYAPILSRAFSLRGIPVFLDAKRSMLGHPVVELMLSAVRAASSLYCPELIRMIKTGLCGVDADDGEAFENYCLMRGFIGGKVFEKPFPEEHENAERARLTLIPPLIKLREGLMAKPAGEKTRAVYDYLQELDIYAKLSDEANMLKLEGRLTLMEEHEQVYSILMEMLEQLYAILGSVEMGSREFLEVLSEALSAYQVGLIPATADQVLFGDYKRTRSAELRALFLLGCNEGLMPAAAPDDGVIDDAELNELKENGCSLSDNAAAKMQAELLYIYKTLAKANETLWLGMSYSDGAKELLPASIIKSIQELFPELEEQAPKNDYPESEKSGFLRLIRSLDEKDEFSRALYEYYSRSETYKHRLKSLESFKASGHTPRSLGLPHSRRLYGTKYFGSVSRLETYKKCPYRYFLEHGLKIMPRREFGHKRTDTGSLAHMALERFIKSLIAQNRDFKSITDDEAISLMDSIFATCLDEYEQGLFTATPRARMLSGFTLEALRQTCIALVKSIAKGEFLPVTAEVRFGADGELCAVELPNGAKLSGLIDRIDVTKSGEYRVVDYKTGASSISFGDIYDGSSLQLPLYLAAAQSYGNPAGMYYQPVKNPTDENKDDELMLNGLMSEEAVPVAEHGLIGKSEIIKSLRVTLKGKVDAGSAAVIEGDELNLLISFALERANDTVNDMLKGIIEARPAATQSGSSCDYCAYKSVCRFDKRQKGCRMRKIPRLNKKAFFQTIRGE